MPISLVGGVGTSQTFAAKLLQALGIVEATSLWSWGVLLLAVAATLACILNTHKLTGFIPWDVAVAGASQSLSLIPGSDSDSESGDDAGASAQQGEEEKGSERVEPKAAPARRIDVPDSDRRTKGQQLWMEGEDQMGSVGGENWDISNGEVVKLWPQGVHFRGGDLTVSQSLLMDDRRKRPVVVISGDGGIQVYDQRASCQSPVMSAYGLSPQKPVSEIGYEGSGKIFFTYSGGGRDDVLVRDLRMLGPNFDGRASSNRRSVSPWWEEDAVIVPTEHEHGKDDEFQIVGYEDSLKFPEWSRPLDAINSRSMVFRCLDAVRSLSSGLVN